MLVKIVVSLLVCVYVCSAHLCMVAPIQRTPIGNLHVAGDPSCDVTDPMPCGGAKPKGWKFYLRGGRNFTIVFQKNENLFNPSKPGYFSVSMGTPSDLKELARIPDTNTPSLTMYKVSIVIPTVKKPQQLIMQAKYVSHHRKAPKAYVQCSDVMLVAKNSGAPEPWF